MSQETIKKPQGKPQRTPKPSWLKVRPPLNESYHRIKGLLKDLNLATVCQEAQCPNIGECWDGGTATFMLMGEVCTRGCRFCAVKTGNPKGAIDKDEPQKVGYAIAQMGLDYVVITSVNRDDLEDQGAGHFAETVKVIRENDPNLIVEILTPDFRGRADLVQELVKAQPHVFAHNVETVERLTPSVRDPRATYVQSLFVLEEVKKCDPKMYTKTSLMLGLGESDKEIMQSLRDLRNIDCDVVTFGQYLQPKRRHHKVIDYVRPEKFDYWKKVADDMGFLYCASGPLVRSSYKAAEFFMKGVVKKEQLQQNLEDQKINSMTQGGL